MRCEHARSAGGEIAHSEPVAGMPFWSENSHARSIMPTGRSPLHCVANGLEGESELTAMAHSSVNLRTEGGTVLRGDCPR